MSDEATVKTAKADSKGKDTLDSAFAMIRKMKEKVDKLEAALKQHFGVNVEGSSNTLSLIGVFVIAAMIPLCLWAATTVWDISSTEMGTCKVESTAGVATLTVDTAKPTTLYINGTQVTASTATLISNATSTVYCSNLVVKAGGTITIPAGTLDSAGLTGDIAAARLATNLKAAISNLFTSVPINGTNYFMLKYP